MKILFSFLTILMLNKDCNQNKLVETNSASMNSKQMTDMNQEYSKVWYEATTRGFYQKIWITKDSVTMTSDRNLMEKVSYPTPEGDWDALLELIMDINIDDLPNLEAPTGKRHYDGAAFATLAIVKGEDEIKSNNFDHGYPPEAIEAIVNKVMSIKEKFEKN